MKMKVLSFVLLFGVPAVPLLRGQTSNAESQVPIYRLTVESRAIRAVNYGQRTRPTKIDFKGTVLLPMAKGKANVKGAAGTVEVDAEFENLEPPSRFGGQYLTYVLWAITPDGRPVNLGEVLSDASNKSKLKVTTQLQTFGLIVTAEPYFAVTQPSSVVVLENVLRPDTMGKVAEVEAKYELLTRDNRASEGNSVVLRPSQTSGKPIPIDQYDALVAVYQAQNALQIARSQGADRFAGETFVKAEQLYQQALRLKDENPKSKRVIALAREAAQTAEDARAIAVKRKGRALPTTAPTR